ncbi:MAG: division/cell wall cluster transcriptional repressor MraZ [Acidobacteria bacterium]|nr:division/cell wall cluster transcriptional repressor MraZ [Acidobacteriota bacterium]
MLRGHHPARIDDKGRLKIPAPFKLELEQQYGEEFYVTSLESTYVRVYPMEEWNKVERRLAESSTFNKVRRKFLDRANYYGQVVRWDKQGRILLPTLLREVADMKGEVAVLGNLGYLSVWNKERFLKHIESNPITPEDEELLDQLGI